MRGGRWQLAGARVCISGKANGQACRLLSTLAIMLLVEFMVQTLPEFHSYLPSTSFSS